MLIKFEFQNKDGIVSEFSTSLDEYDALHISAITEVYNRIAKADFEGLSISSPSVPNRRRFMSRKRALRFYQWYHLQTEVDLLIR